MPRERAVPIRDHSALACFTSIVLSSTPAVLPICSYVSVRCIMTNAKVP